MPLGSKVYGWGGGILQLHGPVAAAQTLAPNDFKSTRKQHMYPGYFDFAFVQWEGVETLI